MTDVDAVTGAFSYSGAEIARELVAAGRRVRTLTGHPDRAPADLKIEVRPLDFENPNGLANALTGIHTLYNTYWVRFAHGKMDHQHAVANTRILFQAARRAGVRRIVHVSITNPCANSPYSYFRGKADVEQILVSLGVPYAIARPAILFGGDGVLINNVAWLLRHFPLFPIGGRGTYRVRGIHVADLGRLCVALGRRSDNLIVDAVGPESLTFRELVESIRAAIGSRALVIQVPGALVPTLAAALNVVLRDRLLTRDEYHAMSSGLADSTAPATGTIRFTDWVAAHGPELGRSYANEFHRHFGAPAASDVAQRAPQ